MEQTKKVTKVRENIKSYPNKMDKTGKNPTVYVHGITIEGDAIEWEYHSLSQTCTNFVPTQEATFTTEVKQNGNYTNHKIAPSKVEKPFVKSGFGGGGKYVDNKSQEVITALSAASSAATFYSNRGAVVNDSQLLETAEKIYQWAMTKKL